MHILCERKEELLKEKMWLFKNLATNIRVHLLLRGGIFVPHPTPNQLHLEVKRLVPALTMKII